MGELVHYITDVVPVHKRKGNEVKVFIREFNPDTNRGNTIISKTTIDHIVASKELKRHSEDPTELTLYKAVEVLKADTLFSDHNITFSSEPYSTKKSVIHARLQDHARRNINLLNTNRISQSLFHTKLSKYSDYLRCALPLFSQVEKIGDKYIIPPEYVLPVDIRHIVNDVFINLDIETENWDKEEPDIISMIVLTPNQEHLPRMLISRYGKGLDGKVMAGYTFKHAPDHQAMKDVLESFFKELQPVGLIEYNGAKFDERKLRELLVGYRPGVDDTQSRFIPSPSSKQGVDINGIHVIDLFNVLYPPVYFLKKGRLDNYLEYFNLNFQKKSLNYFQLKQAFMQAKEEDKKEGANYGALEDAANYTIQDGNKNRGLGNLELDGVFRDAIGMQLSPRTVCLSFGSAAEKYWDDLFFKRSHTYRKRYLKINKRKGEKFKELKPGKFEAFFLPFKRIAFGTEQSLAFREKYGIVREEENVDPSTPTIPKHRLFETQEGMFNKVIALHPLLLQDVFLPIIQSSDYLQMLHAQFKAVADSHEKYRVSWKLKRALVAPLKDYLAFLKDLGVDFDLPIDTLPEYFATRNGEALTTNRDYGFGSTYGLHFQTRKKGFSQSNNLVELSQRLAQVRNELTEDLISIPLLNYNQEFYFVQSDKIPRHCLAFGKGTLFTHEKRSMFYDEDRDKIFYINAKLYNANKTVFEQQLFEKILRHALISFNQKSRVQGIEPIIDAAFAQLKSREIEKSHLLYKDDSLWYGLGQGQRIPVIEPVFMQDSLQPNVHAYKKHFIKVYGDLVGYLRNYDTTHPQMTMDLFA